MKEIITEDGTIIKHPMFRTPYNFDRDANSLETATTCEEETLTQQQFKEECDINTIVERFGITGELPTNVRQPMSEDFIEAFDFQSAQNAIIEARQAFMEMPAKLRARFDNDPGKFIEFFEHEDNRAEAEKMGLVRPKETPTPAPASPVDAPPAAG